MKIKEVLLKAADYINQHGLHKGEFVDRHGWKGPDDVRANGLLDADGPKYYYGAPCCSFGAVALVMCASPLSTRTKPMEDCLERALELEDRGQHPAEFEWTGKGNVPNYNDHPDTTKEDVIALFYRAAEQECANQEVKEI